MEDSVPIDAETSSEVPMLATETDDFSDLMAASFSSLDFWDNPWDDEDWNNA